MLQHATIMNFHVAWSRAKAVQWGLRGITGEPDVQSVLGVCLSNPFSDVSGLIPLRPLHRHDH